MIPLMPKGVEHYCEDPKTSIKISVMIPLMPKGVEHMKDIERQLSGTRCHIRAHKRLCAIVIEIQRGKYPTRMDLVRIVVKNGFDPPSVRTIQRDLSCLRNDFDAPLEFHKEKQGFYFTDPSWKTPFFQSQEEWEDVLRAIQVSRDFQEKNKDAIICDMIQLIGTLSRFFPSAIRAELMTSLSAIQVRTGY